MDTYERLTVIKLLWPNNHDQVLFLRKELIIKGPAINSLLNQLSLQKKNQMSKERIDSQCTRKDWNKEIFKIPGDIFTKTVKDSSR